MKNLYKTITVIIIISLLSACQPSPEMPPVIGKDDLVQKIMQTADPQQPLNIKDKWEETLEFQSGVQVVINADIKIPQVTAYPVFEVKKHIITQDEVQSYTDYFMQNKPIYETEYVRTKAEVELDIIETKAMIEDAKINKNFGSEEIRQMNIDDLNATLKLLEKEYAQAPEYEPELEPATASLKEGNAESGDYQYMSIQADLGNSVPATLSIYIDLNHDSRIYFKNLDGLFFDNFYFKSMYTVAGLNITQHDAQIKAEEALEEIGITNTQLESVKVMVDTTGIDKYTSDSDAVLDPERNKFFEFRFSRVFKGVPSLNIEPCYGIQTGSSASDEYYDIWEAEEIVIGVNDSGIVMLRWYNSGDITRVINENVRLLEFDKIQEIFRKQIYYQRTWANGAMQNNCITVKSVILNLMRVKKKDEGTYLLMPVWDFIGDWTCTERSKDIITENVSFLTINAIDGSVINRYVGY